MESGRLNGREYPHTLFATKCLNRIPGCRLPVLSDQQP